MRPVIYNEASEQIIQQLQGAGLYETFMAQVSRTEPGPSQIFILIDKTPQICRYYLYHRGFFLEHDNGFSSLTIFEPESCPEVVEEIETALKESFTSDIQTLWVDDPERRN